MNSPSISLAPSSTYSWANLLKNIDKILRVPKKAAPVVIQYADIAQPGETFRPLGVQFINRGFHESMIEELSQKSFLHDTEGKTLVLFNSSSVDSLFAAGILASLDRGRLFTFVNYNPLQPELASTDGFRNLVVVGVELMENDLRTLVAHEHLESVTVFSYRDSYSWCTESALTKNKDSTIHGRVRFFCPSDLARESYGELVDRTDNTAIRLVSIYARLAQPDFDSMVSKELLDVSVLACRMVSLAFPVAPLEFPFGATRYSDKDVKDSAEGHLVAPIVNTKQTQREQMEVFRDYELRNRAQVFNMTQQLRKILTGFSPSEQVARLVRADGSMVYSIMENDARSTVNRSLIKDFVSGIPMIHASESQNTIMMGLLVNIYKAFITYEDQRGYRVWRIYSSDAKHAIKIGARFNHRAVWSDGVCWCVVTDLPAVELKPAGKV